jgi:hypothetical protein
MEDDIRKHTEKMKEIAFKLENGQITYKDAREQAKPHLDALNKRSMEISEKLGAKYKKFTIGTFTRGARYGIH